MPQTGFMTPAIAAAEQVLRDVFHLESFRPGQAETYMDERWRPGGSRRSELIVEKDRLCLVDEQVEEIHR